MLRLGGLVIEFGCRFKVCVWSEDFRGSGKSNIGGASAGVSTFLFQKAIWRHTWDFLK